MPRAFFSFLSVILILVLFSSVGGAPLPMTGVLAHYPLQSDGVDATGNNGDMIIENAPFQDGGIYCNGIYYMNPGGYNVRTPSIAALNFDSFAISGEFKISEYPSPGPKPIFTGGTTYRWMGAEITTDGRLGMLYNNSNHVASSTTVSLDTWHQVILVYDGSTQTGSIYLDNEFISSMSFVIDHGDVRNVTLMNPAAGTAFKGVFRELVIYDAAYDPTPAEQPTWGTVRALYR
jgi:hypothetical protein